VGRPSCEALNRNSVELQLKRVGMGARRGFLRAHFICLVVHDGQLAGFFEPQIDLPAHDDIFDRQQEIELALDTRRPAGADAQIARFEPRGER